MRLTSAGLTAGLLVIAAAAPAARGDLATFDGLAEGFYTNVLTDGGITFSRPWDKIDPPDAGQIFAVDNAADLPAAFPGVEAFISGNALNINAYSDGGGLAVGRVGSFDMTPAGPRTEASISVLALVHDPNAGIDFRQNSIGLEAYLNGQLVGSTSLVTADGQWTTTRGAVYGGFTLSLSGPEFDMVRFVTDGPAEGGAGLLSVDNVAMNIPEPAAGAALGGLMLLAARRKR